MLKSANEAKINLFADSIPLLTKSEYERGHPYRGRLPAEPADPAMLTGEGYDFRGVQDGPMALTVIENKPPELILLDIRLPEMNGYGVCKRLKADESHRYIPVGAFAVKMVRPK